ncbi:MAG: DUF5678 domain-containing protein [Oculatellaceae cyanobacterium Prado106]|nr:DUF5678 domain-containing protein [Oculatellaceae cyanobacterium Prado106]
MAIENNQVVAVGSTYREICDRFKESGREWMPLIIEVPNAQKSEGIFL